jgi:RNA polymerase sigma factor (sigma-70 family)
MSDSSQILGELFVREKARFLGFVRRRFSSLAGMDAEDILSEVTYNLLRRADVVGEVENLTAYIYRSLANRITDQQRQAASQMAMPAPGDASGEALSGAHNPAQNGALNGAQIDASHAGAASQTDRTALLPDPRPRPDQSLQQAELRRRLFLAIDELSPPERAVWIATEIEGQSFRELADDWDEPIGTLLSRKSRANEKLRRMLSDYKDYR